jgi:hypothetical protein
LFRTDQTGPGWIAYPVETANSVDSQQVNSKTTSTPQVLTYKDAGVDIDAGEALVDAIKPMCKSTRRKGCDAALGGFGGLFDLAAAG